MQEPIQKEKKPNQKLKKQTNFIEYSGMAFQMGATIGLFIYLGFKLDAWLKTKVLFVLIGALLGVGLALYTFIKKAMTENK